MGHRNGVGGEEKVEHFEVGFLLDQDVNVVLSRCFILQFPSICVQTVDLRDRSECFASDFEFLIFEVAFFFFVLFNCFALMH